MTATDLQQLAIDISNEKVFGSWMIPKEHLSSIATVFMPLAFKGHQKLPENVWALYEYYNKAGKLRTISNLPVFLSMKYLTEKDCNLLQILLKEIEKSNHEIKQKLEQLCRKTTHSAIE